MKPFKLTFYDNIDHDKLCLINPDDISAVTPGSGMRETTAILLNSGVSVNVMESVQSIADLFDMAKNS